MNALDNISKEIRTGNVTKASIQAHASKLTESVRSGDIEAYKAYADLYALSKVITAAMDAIKDDAVEELAREKQGIAVYGMKLTAKSGNRRFTYDHIPAWKEKKAELTEIEKAAKLALESIVSGHLIDKEGTVIEPAKETYNKSTVNVEIPKE